MELVTLEVVAREIQSGGRIAILTGAGISAESGISTFRDAGGLWEQHSLENVATPEGFERDPELVQRFYNQRRRRLSEVKPNAAHLALARLEDALADRLTLITQNVDDLHQRAGSRRVLHMHGELLKARCNRCGEVRTWPGDIAPQDLCPSCGAGLRPHVVWFGEMPFFMDREIPEALRSEVFVSIGTSGVVYPAAGFVAEARRNGALTVEINLEPTPNARLFQLTLAGKASERVPEFVAAVTARP